MLRRKALSVRGAWLEKQDQHILAMSQVKQRKPSVFHSDDTDDDLSDVEEPVKITSRRVDNLFDESTADEGSPTDAESTGSAGTSPRMSPHAVTDCLDLLTLAASPKVALDAGDDHDVMDLLGVEVQQSSHHAQEDSLLDF